MNSSLLLTQINDTRNVVASIYQINEALKLPFNLDGQELFITISVGISLFPDDGIHGHSLLRNAGSALCRAREHGGNNHQFYTAGMNAKALHLLTLENSFQRALERSEFEVYYQPQLKISTREIVGIEALIRWHHPEVGLVSPAEFIPLAEDTGVPTKNIVRALITYSCSVFPRQSCTLGVEDHDRAPPPNGQ